MWVLGQFRDPRRFCSRKLPAIIIAIPRWCFLVIVCARGKVFVVFALSIRVRLCGSLPTVNRSLKIICIPRSITTICASCLSECISLRNVAFESNAILIEIPNCTFSSCDSLQCISLPALVQVHRDNCFDHCTSLSTITFDRGSNLIEIGGSVFRWDSSIRFISLPASLEKLHGSAFMAADISITTVEQGNSFFRVESSFHLSIDGLSIARYFGHESEVVIESEITAFSDHCFSHNPSISLVLFEL
jgi:hypothetical protein